MSRPKRPESSGRLRDKLPNQWWKYLKELEAYCTKLEREKKKETT